jgi:hypothetical protein
MATAIPDISNETDFFLKSECVNYVMPGERVSINEVVIDHMDFTIHNLYNDAVLLESPSKNNEKVISLLLIIENKGKAIVISNKLINQRVDYGSINRFVLNTRFDIYTKADNSYNGISFDCVNKLI